MRVFISADIEGTAFTTLWSETETDSSLYPAAARQMTAEVRAACEGAIAAGADFILVKDAHGKGINIDPNGLPREAVLERGWSGSPMAMADGVDESFDAAMFVGYHSPAGERGNPLSHTYSKKTTRVLLNGVPCSEFMLYSFACVTRGVPCVLLTGDRALTDASRALHPKLMTVAVKEGFGGLTRCLNPALACDKIRDAAKAALSQELSGALPALPAHFKFELFYKEHTDAVRLSFFPGCSLTEQGSVLFETDDYFELLRCAKFIM